MGCKCASETDQYHGWECSVTEGACMFTVPDSKLCAEIYGEGPDANEEEKKGHYIDNHQKYECWSCNKQFIVGKKLLEDCQSGNPICPYCGVMVSNEFCVVWTEDDMLENLESEMGCLAIYVDEEDGGEQNE